MSASLLLLIAAVQTSPAQASTDQANSVVNGIVLRPDTYVVDTRLSTGSIENFTKLFVDPDAFVKGLMPAAPPQAPKPPAGQPATAPSFPPTGHLLLVNEHLDEAEVSVNGTQVGLVHAATEAVLHDVRSGCYDVTWAYRDDYSYTNQVCTVAAVRAPFPGGPTAAIYLDQGRPERAEPEWRFGPPDRDKDGIADDEDECQDEPGPADSFGCPDKDLDRVPDYRDECPEVAGPKRADARRSNGCPARVFIAAKEIVITDKIFFATNRATIKPASFGLLDELVAIFEKHPEIKRVEIAGHTDSQGRDSYNLKLSDDRAKAVMQYFVDKGVDAGRLQAQGYGETQPMADNETEEGRAANRRVEFRILEQEQRIMQRRLAPGEDPGEGAVTEDPTGGEAVEAPEGRPLERVEPAPEEQPEQTEGRKLERDGE